MEWQTSTNKHAITSVIPYYMDRNRVMREPQLTFDEIDRLFFPLWKSHCGWLVKGQHTGARVAVDLTEVVDCYELTNGRLLGITTDNASSNYSMTGKLQSTVETSGIEWPASRNHIPCTAHVIQLALGAFMRSLCVKGCTQFWEAPECNQ